MKAKEFLEINTFKLKEGENVKQNFLYEILRRQLKMTNEIDGCYGFHLYEKLYEKRTFVRCIRWNSKEIALKYSEERNNKDGFKKFLNENVEDFYVEFLEQIDL
jgi:heme-degrading monooxygenase HmoA